VSLENVHLVDAIGLDRDSGAAVLTIMDSWDWSDEQHHLLTLQQKINTYLAFIQTGEIVESYPHALGKKIVIDIIGMHPMPPRGKVFLEKASATAAELDVQITFRVHPPR